MVRCVPYYYLHSFQKIASLGSYDEILLTTNKRWNYFIILPPAAREDVLPVLSLSPMCRRCCHRCASVFAVVAIEIVALVARRRAGVVACAVIIVVGVVVLSGVVNVVIRRNRPGCCHRCCQRCHPSQSLPLSLSLSSIIPSPSTSLLLPLS
jgi:hypothetical protein